MAIDGDPTTSWTVGDRGPALGEYIQLRRERADRPSDAAPARHGRRATAHHGSRDDDRRSRPVRSSPSTTRSLVGDGQRIDIEPTDGREPHHAAHHRAPERGSMSPDRSGDRRRRIRHVDFGLEPTSEVIRVPIDATTALTATDATDSPQCGVHPAPHRPDGPLEVRSGTGTAPAVRRAARTRPSTRLSSCARTDGWTTPHSRGCSASRPRRPPI